MLPAFSDLKVPSVSRVRKAGCPRCEGLAGCPRAGRGRRGRLCPSPSTAKGRGLITPDWSPSLALRPTCFLLAAGRELYKGCFALHGLSPKVPALPQQEEERSCVLLGCLSPAPVLPRSSCGPEHWPCRRVPPAPLPGPTETAHGPQLSPSR